MGYFNFYLSHLFDLLLSPFKTVAPLWPLLIFSLVTGIIMLIIFRYTSNQKGIKEAKDKIRAYLYEIRLFKDDLGIQLSAQKNILIHNFRYMRHALKPMLFMIVPVVLILVQLEGWFGNRPLKLGESTIVSVNFSEDYNNDLSGVTLQTDEGILVETPPLRIPTEREINWRVRANHIGEHVIRFNVSGTTFKKSLIVSDGQLTRVSRMIASGFWDNLLYPGEQPLAKNSPMNKIEVDYPSRSIEILGWHIHWLVAFLILSIAFGFAFKGLLKVEI